MHPNVYTATILVPNILSYLPIVIEKRVVQVSGSKIRPPWFYCTIIFRIFAGFVCFTSAKSEKDCKYTGDTRYTWKISSNGSVSSKKHLEQSAFYEYQVTDKIIVNSHLRARVKFYIRRFHLQTGYCSCSWYTQRYQMCVRLKKLPLSTIVSHG